MSQQSNAAPAFVHPYGPEPDTSDPKVEAKKADDFIHNEEPDYNSLEEALLGE